jgi:hypothetical protein
MQERGRSSRSGSYLSFASHLLLFTLDLHLQLCTPTATIRALTRASSSINATYLQHPRPLKDPSSANTLTDSAKTHFPHDQADHQAMQLRSTPIPNTMDDPVDAAHSSLHKADHQSYAEMPATSTADAAADSVNDNFPRDQADHQTGPELPSTSMTSTQAHGQEHAIDATDAAETVLGIPELLLLIISEVPLNNRTSLRPVSKTWQAAVEMIGHVLEPAGYGCWGISFDSFPSVPGYLVESGGGEFMGLKHNGSSGLPLKKVHAYNFHRSDYAAKTVGLGLYNRKKLLMHENEFITYPPITQVLICAKHTGRWYSGIRDRGVASLRVRGGIRIRDLLECLEKLDPTLTRTCLHARYYVRFAWQSRGTKAVLESVADELGAEWLARNTIGG